MADFPADLAGFETRARERLDPAAWDYLSRGFADNVTLTANVDAWTRLRLCPHVLRDVSDLDTRTTVLGTEVTVPILVAPTAMHRFFCEEGETATARAAASVGTVYVTSMAATTSLEDVAAAAPDVPRWAQMYMLSDRGRTRALAGRARAAGYRAVVASVDGAAVPTARRTTPPQASLTPPDWFRFPNLASPGDDTADVMALVEDFDPSVTFDDLAHFAEWSGLPVAVKGVLRGDDAARCVDAGASAVIVSNHGGRMLDGVIATGDALPGVVAGVDGRAEVYVDGGIRSGVDVAKAIALGARAVLVGRPVLWGLTVGGAEGAEHVLHLLGDQFAKAMAFCGAACVGDLARDLVTSVGANGGETR
ncbi:MAG TPA: alpha-hydroxy acid oxidase [Acidimicrobiia bacterium]|nr:alpha-hydroxy acid oxidase [Acidimicrobiia bacterium]